MINKKVETVRAGLRKFNRWAGVLKSDPYGLGLSLSQAGALVDLQRFECLRPAQLADLLMLDRSTVSRLIVKLERDGLIRVSTSEQDGRGRVVRLAAKGIAALKVIHRVSDDSVAAAFEHLTANEQAEVARAFEKLASAVEKAEEKSVDSAISKT